MDGMGNLRMHILHHPVRVHLLRRPGRRNCFVLQPRGDHAERKLLHDGVQLYIPGLQLQRRRRRGHLLRERRERRHWGKLQHRLRLCLPSCDQGACCNANETSQDASDYCP